MNVPEASAAAPTLEQASRALWAATLSLMAAFMQQPAPAHRLLLARRIARNFETLRQQECFTPATRASFSRLAQRWDGHARRLDSRAARPGFLALLKPVWLRSR